MASKSASFLPSMTADFGDCLSENGKVRCLILHSTRVYERSGDPLQTSTCRNGSGNSPDHVCREHHCGAEFVLARSCSSPSCLVSVTGKIQAFTFTNNMLSYGNLRREVQIRLSSRVVKPQPGMMRCKPRVALPRRGPRPGDHHFST